MCNLDCYFSSIVRGVIRKTRLLGKSRRFGSVGGSVVEYVITYSTITLVTPSRWSADLTSKNSIS
jgi:hypothetical protein